MLLQVQMTKKSLALEVYLPVRKAGDTQCDVIYMIQIYVYICVWSGVEWRQELKESRNEASWIILWPEKTSQARIYLQRSEEGREAQRHIRRRAGLGPRTSVGCLDAQCLELGWILQKENVLVTVAAMNTCREEMEGGRVDLSSQCEGSFWHGEKRQLSALGAGLKTASHIVSIVRKQEDGCW